MGAEEANGVKQLLDFAKKQPFPGGFLIGAIASGLFSYLLAKLAFKGHDGIVREWKSLTTALKKELKELKQQIQEKDQRLHLCHQEIHELKKLQAGSANR